MRSWASALVPLPDCSPDSLDALALAPAVSDFDVPDFDDDFVDSSEDDDEGEPVGMAAAMPSREDFEDGPLVPGLCYLDLIFVVPERWGDGIGALLLDTVLADARGRGFSRIHLLTHDDNERAQTLYASRSFAKTGWSRMSRDAANGMVSEWAREL